MQKRIVATFIAASLTPLMLMSVACAKFFYSEEKKETKRLYEYLQESDSLDGLEYWKITESTNSSAILSFKGTCSLEKIYSITECSNKYLEEHSNSCFLENNSRVEIRIFSIGADQRSYDGGHFYASVVKRSGEKCFNELIVNTDETIRLSMFRSCPVNYDSITVSFNLLFDDYDVLAEMQNLQYFEFTEDPVNTDRENLLRVLESVCYYESHGIVLSFSFRFNLHGEMKSVYDDFVLSHQEYKVFGAA